ncbi:MAG: dTMP kinase [Dehalococcoidia bacterium]
MAFIVFEGGDGAGKSTQSRSLLRRMQRRSYPTLLTHEPGGTPLGESLRRSLKGPAGILPLAELFLFSAARAQLVAEVIRPALNAGTHVICDRFTASTVAYQGFGRGLDLTLIRQLNQVATDGLAPDLIVLLDIPVEIGLSRKRGIAGDTFEAAPWDFHRRVREGFLSQAEQDPSRWLVLDATRTPRDLSGEIWAKVQPLL